MNLLFLPSESLGTILFLTREWKATPDILHKTKTKMIDPNSCIEIGVLLEDRRKG